MVSLVFIRVCVLERALHGDVEPKQTVCGVTQSAGHGRTLRDGEYFLRLLAKICIGYNIWSVVAVVPHRPNRAKDFRRTAERVGI